jgi:hypothetical protein
MSDKLGQCPVKIVIFGIEPYAVKPGCELSKTLADRFEEYIDVILKELQKINPARHYRQPPEL